MQFLPILFGLLIFWTISRVAQNATRNQSGQSQKKTGQAAQQPPAEVTKAAAARPADMSRSSRLMPTVSVTEHDDSIYQGSMNAVTGEGYDPCHDEQLSSLSAAASAPDVLPVSQDKARLPFGWTGNDIVRGFVVSEILNRKQ